MHKMNNEMGNSKCVCLVLQVFIVSYWIAKCIKERSKREDNVPLFNDEWFDLRSNEMFLPYLSYCSFTLRRMRQSKEYEGFYLL